MHRAISYRGHRDIDYSDPGTLSRRKDAKAAQRHRAALGTWVIGRWDTSRGLVVLVAIRRQPAWNIDLAKPLTDRLDQFARWNTRQAARQYRNFNDIRGLRLINLATLPGSILLPRQHANQNALSNQRG